MSKEICDICGNEFVWKKGMAYCSYDCAQKARQKLEQQAEKYQEKIKKETQCPACGFVGVDIEQWCNDDHGICWETFYKCKKCGRKTKDKQWYVYKKPTLFDRITASPEVLAEKFVYRTVEFFYDDNHKPEPNHIYYVSALLVSKNTGGKIYFETKEDALAATVAKLKEVAE